MSIEQILLGGILVVFVIALIRAANLLSGNPYQQQRAHEELVGRVAPERQAEQARLMTWLGLSPQPPQRIYWLIVAVCAAFGLTLYLASFS